MNPSVHTPALDADALRAAMAVATFAMATLIETRDSDSDNHILRVQHYVKALAQQLQAHPAYHALLSDAYIQTLFESTPMYDMGTVCIPDRILLKPSRLTPSEFEIMKTHTTLARDAIEKAERTLGCHADALRMVKELAYSHQEKWDGSGYPQGLAGEAIPLSARLLAVADVYDALISDRVYKAGISHEKAVGIIFQSRDSHFAPELVDAFMEISDTFHAIALRFADTAQDMEKKISHLANAIAEDAEL